MPHIITFLWILFLSLLFLISCEDVGKGPGGSSPQQVSKRKLVRDRILAQQQQRSTFGYGHARTGALHQDILSQRSPIGGRGKAAFGVQGKEVPARSKVPAPAPMEKGPTKEELQKEVEDLKVKLKTMTDDRDSLVKVALHFEKIAKGEVAGTQSVGIPVTLQGSEPEPKLEPEPKSPMLDQKAKMTKRKQEMLQRKKEVGQVSNDGTARTGQLGVMIPLATDWVNGTLENGTFHECGMCLTCDPAALVPDEGANGFTVPPPPPVLKELSHEVPAPLRPKCSACSGCSAFLRPLSQRLQVGQKQFNRPAGATKPHVYHVETLETR
ncbi:hypothetical protein CYMTET_28565, partial [Cymbomonas tetramitiformis]